jgi:hypothetical protein
MEGLVKIIVGLVLLGAGLGYLYRPAWILRFNAWGRTVFFNDAYVLFYRRRWGLPLFFLAILFFYSGFMNLSRHRAQRESSSVVDLAPAAKALSEGHYDEAIRLAQEVLSRAPASRPARTLLETALEHRRRVSVRGTSDVP